MTVVFNGTTLATKPVFNGTTIDTIIFNGTKVLGPPDAPTIGTATSSTAGIGASITFTPGADYGYTISSFTCTASPGGVTQTGASSPITITGLTAGAAYTFTVTATNIFGTGAASSASNSVTTYSGPLGPSGEHIGSPLGGGYFAGLISTTGNGVATHYLVLAPSSTGELSATTWGPTSGVVGASSLINGLSNTTIAATSGIGTFPAASFCYNLATNGYSDWYLPAKNELEVVYYFLKSGTWNNNTSSGSNANAVSPEPVSTNYTTSRPAATAAVDFVTGGADALLNDVYYSSTETGDGTVWGQSMGSTGAGFQDSTVWKFTPTKAARAVRKIAI